MKTFQLMSAADASMTQVSCEVDVGDLTVFSVEETFSSATLNGTLTLEASNDNATYITVSGSSVTVVSGAANMHEVADFGSRFVRVRWVPSSGTGTITALCVVKEPANRF